MEPYRREKTPIPRLKKKKTKQCIPKASLGLTQLKPTGNKKYDEYLLGNT